MVELKKTKFASYCLNGIPDGCKMCVRGEKLVLFVTGICSTGCAYCPLSNKRKNIDLIYANERECENVGAVVQEARESNSKGAGITGGDPLLKLERTFKFCKRLKKEFGSYFHIHIYLSTKLVSDKNLKKLSSVIDEVRFHPMFLGDSSLIDFDFARIKLGKKYFKKVGIEMPVFPDRKKEILNFLLKVGDFIDFVNLNESEIGETNCDYVQKKYFVDKNGYTIKNSVKEGKWILNKLKEKKVKFMVHFCTAKTKNWFQFKNRLLKHKILPFGKRTDDGTVIYFVIDSKKVEKNLGNKVYFDEFKKRYIVDPCFVNELKKDYKIKRVEEFPTFDALEVEEFYV